jgi:hypothetical protein
MKKNMTSKSNYTIILNYYNKSVDLLNNQLESVLNQTLKPEVIIGCFMGGEQRTALRDAFIEKTKDIDNAFFVDSDYNFKYIGRYQLALTAPTDYVIVLDDDRNPMLDYCRTMIDILKKEDCIVQQYGWSLREPEEYKGTWLSPAKSFQSTQSELIEATYLCGGMAFRKSSLKHLFSEDIYTTATGEDIMFCLRCKKNDIPVYAYMPDLKNNLDQLLEHDSEGVNFTFDNTEMKKIRDMILEREGIWEA